MSVELTNGSPYTVLSIPEWTGFAKRTEIVVENCFPREGFYGYRERGRQDLAYSPVVGELEMYLLFEGHDLPFTLDVELGCSRLLGVFNFICDSPDELRKNIKQYCINPSFEKFRRMLYMSWRLRNAHEPKSTFLFPECLTQSKLFCYHL